MPPQQWHWDPSRRQYYLFHEAENIYEYQNGLRIQGPARAQPPPPAPQPAQRNQADPRTVSNVPRSTITSASGINAGVDEITRGVTQTSIGHGYGAYGGQYNLAGAAPSTTDASTVVAMPILTDQRLQVLGVQAKGAIRGASRDTELLYPEFKVQKPGKKFFKRGKVFKVLWPEILGQPNDSVTMTSDGKYGERIASKIRWFIVVMEGENFTTCLPINTYNRQGVSKRGVVKSNHAIAFYKSEEPRPQDSELPARDESPMMPGIRIKPKRKGDTLDKWSRIDFARMYTVEHNVKVYEFGDVDKAFQNRLVTQWFHIIEKGTQMSTSLTSHINEPVNEEETTAVEEAEDEDEDEDDEEDEDEDEDEDGEEEEEEEGDTAQHHQPHQPHHYTVQQQRQAQQQREAAARMYRSSGKKKYR